MNDENLGPEAAPDLSKYQGPRLTENPISKFPNRKNTSESFVVDSNVDEPRHSPKGVNPSQINYFPGYGKFSKAWEGLIGKTKELGKIPSKEYNKYAKEKSNSIGINKKSATGSSFDASNLLRNFLLRKKLIKFSDKLRTTVGLRNIRKAPKYIISHLNDMSYYQKKKWTESENDEKSDFDIKAKRKSKLIPLFLSTALKNKIINYSVKNLNNLKDFFKRGILEAWAIFEEKIPAFEPFGKLKLFWDTIMLLLIFWHLNSLTILLSFNVRPWQSYSFTLDFLQEISLFNYFKKISMVLFMADIVIKLNTACFAGGSEIYKKTEIVKNYLKDGFLYDLIGLSPFIIFHSRDSNASMETYNYYYWLFIFKLKPLFSFLENIKEGLLYLDGKKEGFYQLLKLMIEVFIICHLFSCIWHLAASKSDTNKNWISYLNLNGQSWEEHYYKAIYYIVVTMTTTGYGDITPQNRLETFISILLMFSGSALVGYSVNRIGSILDTIQADQKSTRHKMRLLNSFMKRHNIKYDLQIKMRKYLEYIWGKHLDQEKKSLDILKELPVNLREEALIDSRAQILRGDNFFFKFFSKETLSKVCLSMRQLDLGPEEWIFSEGEKAKDSIFIVVSGDVELTVKCEKRGSKLPILKLKEPGDYFGERSFFTGFPQEVSARTQGVCSLYKIDRTEFLNIISHNNRDHELFCLIRDKLLMKQTIKKLNIRCFCCDNVEHNFSECPWISPQPLKQITIHKHLYSMNHLRKPFERNRLVKGNTLIGYTIINHAARRIKEMLNIQQLRAFGPESLITMTDVNLNFNIETNDRVLISAPLSPVNEPGARSHYKKLSTLSHHKLSEEHKLIRTESDNQLPHSPISKGSSSHFRKLFEKEEPSNHGKSNYLNIPSNSISNLDESLLSEKSPSLHQSKEYDEIDSKSVEQLLERQHSLEHESSHHRSHSTEHHKSYKPLFNTEFDKFFEWKYYQRYNNMSCVVKKLMNYCKRPKKRNFKAKKVLLPPQKAARK